MVQRRNYNIGFQARIVIQNGTDILGYFTEPYFQPSFPVREIEIQKNLNGFEISIKGGKEFNRPIIISKCSARHENLLKTGDRLISCNGKSLLNWYHDDAVEAIKKSGKIVKIQVQQENWEKTDMPIEIPEIYE